MESTSRTPFPYSKTVLNMPKGPERNLARAHRLRTRKANNKPINNLTRRISNVVVPNAVVPNAIVPNAVVPNAVVPNAIVPNAVVPNAIVPNAVVPNELPPEQRDSNEWEPLPDSEIYRLDKTLYSQLYGNNITVAKPVRINFIKNLLEKQNNTCAFGKNVKGMYCWNEPLPKGSTKKYLKYLKLQWGHIIPKCRDKTLTINDFFLLCVRCNNQIQTGRYLCQLKPELQSKLEHIDDILRS